MATQTQAVTGQEQKLTVDQKIQRVRELYADAPESSDIVKLEPRRPRYDIEVSGEDLRQAFESRLDERDPVGQHVAESTAESSNGRESAAA